MKIDWFFFQIRIYKFLPIVLFILVSMVMSTSGSLLPVPPLPCRYSLPPSASCPRRQYPLSKHKSVVKPRIRAVEQLRRLDFFIITFFGGHMVKGMDMYPNS